MSLNFSFSVQKDIKNEQLKQLLLQCVDKEKDQFAQLANHFYNASHRSDDHYLDLCNAIISAVDGVLNASDWDASLFLRNTIKPLKKIRDHALELRQALGGGASLAASQDTTSLAENCVKLYVSLYQAHGHDLKKWANQLNSIGSYMTGRPVYQNEAEVKKIIRAKYAQISEAYAVVAVDQSNIIVNEHATPRKDRFDSILVSLVPGAVVCDNILEFVHQGKRYYFHNDQLLLQKHPQEEVH